MTIGVSIAAAVTLGVVVSADAASLRGVVRDTQCEVLPGVEVILRGDSTVRQVITGQSGEFAFDDLPEPRYSLEARLQGFQVLSRADVLPSTILKPVLLVLPLGFPAVAQHVEGVTDRGPTGYSVHVLDESCRPVEGAAVSLAAASGAWTGRTDGNGDAPLPDLEHGAYSLRISAPGFSPSSLSADTPPRYRLTITMPLFRGPPEAATLFEPSPSTRVTQPEPMSEPRIRIVAIGDSTTAGTPGYQSPREAPPRGAGDETSQYAYWLMKAHPGWEVINQGVNAQRSDTIAARFDEDVLARKPEVVVILAGVNDVYQGRPAQHVKDQLAAMYQRARAAGIHVVAGTIIPYNTATADQNARMREINTWIRSQADAGLVTFVDTRAAVAAADDPDKLAGSPDGLHPDVAGYRRMADAIAPAIERVLAAR